MRTLSILSRGPIALISMTIVATLFLTAAWVLPAHAQSDRIVSASNQSALPAASTLTAIAVMPIRDLTVEHVGQIVQVHARIVDVTYPARMLEFVLSDGTGKIRLQVVSNDAYKSAQNLAGLNYGADVRVTAQLNIDRGVLYLETLPGGQITVLAPGSTSNITHIPLKHLGKIGVVTAVDGVISDVQTYSDGIHVIVGNETGSIRVKLTKRLLQYVHDAAGLVIGAPVRIVGRIDYARDLMLVPLLGSDVTVR